MAVVRHLRISNFRCIQKFDWTPSPGLNCLIGPGDSGKSTILDAIENCLSPRRYALFGEADFHRLDVSSPIIIDVTLGGLEDRLLDLDAYAGYLRGWKGGGQIEDEPSAGIEPVLTVRMEVRDDMVPRWRLYAERAEEHGARDRDLSAKDRASIAPTRLGAVAATHLSWGQRSILNRIGDERPDAGIFQQVQKDLSAGVRESRPLKKAGSEVSLDEITKDALFIVGGQKAYVAEMGEEFLTEYDRRDRRLRVIYDNGTEAEVLSRSFQRSLHRDDSARRITDPSAGPLFDGQEADGDIASGTIYVLRSKSDHPIVAEHRELVHKIGVTGGSIETRIAAAKTDPTYLLADVEVIASYKLFNINRVKLEGLLHRVLAAARLDLTITDRFGNPVQPREWFLVPLSIIDEVVERIRDQTIVNYVYDPSKAALVVK